jgi:hypothetical protein
MLYLDVTYFRSCLSRPSKTSEGLGEWICLLLQDERGEGQSNWWTFLCHCISSARDRPLLKGRQCSSSLSLFHLKMDKHALSEQVCVVSLRRQTISKTLFTCITIHDCQNSLKLNIFPAFPSELWNVSPVCKWQGNMESDIQGTGLFVLS